MYSELLWRRAYDHSNNFLQDDQRYLWSQNARPSQLPPPGEWRVWLILAGRGFGKTRTGAETVRSWITAGRCRRIALVSQTMGEAQGHLMKKEKSNYLK